MNDWMIKWMIDTFQRERRGGDEAADVWRRRRESEADVWPEAGRLARGLGQELPPGPREQRRGGGGQPRGEDPAVQAERVAGQQLQQV